MEKKSILDIIDQLPVTGKQSIKPNQVQVYRNTASTLKKLKQKHFVIRKVGNEHIIFRLL